MLCRRHKRSSSVINTRNTELPAQLTYRTFFFSRPVFQHRYKLCNIFVSYFFFLPFFVSISLIFFSHDQNVVKLINYSIFLNLNESFPIYCCSHSLESRNLMSQTGMDFPWSFYMPKILAISVERQMERSLSVRSNKNIRYQLLMIGWTKFKPAHFPILSFCLGNSGMK